MSGMQSGKVGCERVASSSPRPRSCCTIDLLRTTLVSRVRQTEITQQQHV